MIEPTGILYLCATPIGNLDDMTYRAVKVLGEVQLIAAEDTRHTRKLLSHFDIHTPLISYHEHNKLERGPEIIEKLLAGQNIAVVSDAGMPGISDPGVDLVKLAIEYNIRVVPIPGANAALSALVCSGIDTTQFIFVGFLPKTKKKRQEMLKELAFGKYSMVFYESPHRVKETLSEVIEVFGDRSAVAARELTKKFEEFIRGTLSSVMEHFEQNIPRGEFTIIISGYQGEQPDEAVDQIQLIPLEEAVLTLVKNGINKKDAIKQVAVKRGLPKREVYQAVLGKGGE